jgi:hypothetical protein
VYLWGFSNVANVSVSNSSIDSNGTVPVGQTCAYGYRTTTASSIVLDADGNPLTDVSLGGPNNGTFSCGGAVGRHIVLAGGGEIMRVSEGTLGGWNGV